MDYFEQVEKLSLRPITSPNTGFRPGQLGGIHAALSHFSVYDDPAIICLPTGYGKTAIIMSLPFVMKAKRVLVVEPSNALRKQTASHFKELSVLKRLNVVAENADNPIVLLQQGQISSLDQWEEMKKYDVVVSTPASSSPVNSGTVPDDLFDLIIFDEAHHAPAETWSAYIEKFSGANFVFLTATPFRRDNKAIPGRLCYFYPVLKASREKAFGKVIYKPALVTNDHNDNEIDQAIASAAVSQLRKDQANGYDHRIFARAASRPKAKELVEVYENEGAKVAAITSYLTKKKQDETEDALINGELDGVVCVDMFGEGYDFPKLKIAALHAPHKSLVPSLQFIGRFARTNDERTSDATLITAPTRLKEATSRLFEIGIDVAELIDEVSREQIERSDKDREILDLLKIKIQRDSDYESVSPLLFKLYAHARIFDCNSTPDFSLVGHNICGFLPIVKQWVSDDGLISLILTVDDSPPNWAKSDAISNLRHDVFLLAYNEATKYCFIGSTRRTDKIYLDLMEQSCSKQHRPVSYEVTRRAIAGLGSLRFYNVGLKNKAVNTQAESYRVLTGPSAERAVTAGDARAFVQGHFFGSGEAEDGRETVGASSSSRVWSNKRLTVSEYLDWLSILNARLSGNDAVAQSQLDIVQHAKVLSEIPIIVIAAGWNKSAYRSAPRIRYRMDGSQNWNFQQITDFDIFNFTTSDDRKSLSFKIGFEDIEVRYIFSISGGALIQKKDPEWNVEVLSGVDDWTAFEQWMSTHPPTFYASDKSSFQGVNQISPPSTVLLSLSEHDTEVLDWGDCDIKTEFNIEKASPDLTVHQLLERELLGLNGIVSLFYDHRSGEAADFIAVTRNDLNEVFVKLYHCKSAGGNPSGGRVDDAYEVAGQMVKSVSYCEVSILCEHMTHRSNENRHINPSAFILGELESTVGLLKSTVPNKLFFEIYAVQPGISINMIDDHLSDLMAFGLEYVFRGGAATAKWIINV
ncbi:MAG: DEAD/DEAH box helicase family protein [Desulfobacter sp.]|nr:MAG: DEAD/DEAH box helicase family protein [Desulfobacter sp.]